MIEFDNYKKDFENKLKLFIDNDLNNYLNYLFLNNDLKKKYLDMFKYSICNGGKRVRPVLSYISSYHLKINDELAFNIALIVEIIHSFSLIHDDLPGIDNDSFRREQLTFHKKFDEANAIIFGDLLLNFAYKICLSIIKKDSKFINCVEYLNYKLGVLGLIGGQLDELNKSSNILDIYYKKTSCLFSISICLPQIYCNKEITKFENFAKLFGENFQLYDDLNDINKQSDLNSYISKFGINNSRERITNNENLMKKLLDDDLVDFYDYYEYLFKR